MNQPLVTVITPTGQRKAALELCAKWLQNQTYPMDKIQYICVSDEWDTDYKHSYPANGGTPHTVELGSFLKWKEGFNTHRLSLMAALPYIKGEHIFFFEDDDFYSPPYIEFYVHLLQKFDLVGEGNAKYYYLPTHVYKEINNYEHTSLASLAFNKSLLPIFERALHSGEPFFDLKFWQYAKEEKVNSLIFTNKNLSIGIKGMPGRKGIGLGHRPEGWDSDPFGKKLMEWLPDNWQDYKPFIGLQKK